MKKAILCILLVTPFILYSCKSEISRKQPTGKSMLITATVPGGLKGAGTAVDENGNIYACGSFNTEAGFGDTTLKSIGASNAYLVKYDSTAKLIWAKTIPGATTEPGGTYGNGIVLDKDGNIYMAGKFNQKADFNGFILEQPGHDHLFLAKFNNDGKIDWAQKIVSAGENDIEDITIDANGNIYITGAFSQSASFGAISINTKGDSNLHTDIFVAKYNSAGVIQWVQSAGGPDGDYADAIEADKQGNVYIAGEFYKNADFGHINKTGTAADAPCMFLAKYNSAGAIQWVETSTGLGETDAVNLAVSTDNHIYIKGFSRGIAKFRNLELESGFKGDNLFAKPQHFIVKYTDAGEPQWVRAIGISDSYSDKNLRVDTEGNIYSADQLKEEVSLDEEKIRPEGKEDLILQKFDKDGNIQWYKTAAFSESCAVQTIVIDNKQHIYVAGNFKGKGNFDEITKTSSGQRDIFIWRFRQ